MTLASWGVAAKAQTLSIRHGNPVPTEVKTLYEAGLQYLVNSQLPSGNWQGGQGPGPGTDGLCCLAILSCGEDPNFGPYAETLRKGLRAILNDLEPNTGIIAEGGGGHGSMYHHGFATLALAEAYGAVDESLLWEGEAGKNKPSLGKALELAVGAIITSQNQNPFGAWRYSPDAKDADTSVSGAIFVALLAARNAGVAVPDESIEKALKYYESATAADGSVGYQSGNVGTSFGESQARSSICCLVYAIAKHKEDEPHKKTIAYLRDHMLDPPRSWKEYTRYYMAQALFQGDFEAWNEWNTWNTEMLRDELGPDGSIGGDSFTTAMNLLSMALNYRFLPIYER
jgi:hypothetical protein